jgi:hypothetical protein
VPNHRSNVLQAPSNCPDLTEPGGSCPGANDTREGVSSTTPKRLARRSEIFLAFTRRRACAFCHRQPPNHAHHYPPKGRLGVADDSRVTPACLECHMRCHRERPDGKAPIEDARQQRAVEENRLAFLQYATPEEWQQFGVDRAARFEHPAVEF